MVIYNIRRTTYNTHNICYNVEFVCYFTHCFFPHYLYIAAGKYPGYFKVDTEKMSGTRLGCELLWFMLRKFSFATL